MTVPNMTERENMSYKKSKEMGHQAAAQLLTSDAHKQRLADAEAEMKKWVEANSNAGQSSQASVLVTGFLLRIQHCNVVL